MIILFRFSLFSVCGSSSTGNLKSISAFVGIIAHKMRSAKINYWSENIFQKKAHEITRLINKRQSWRFESEMSAETCWGWELERWSPKDTWAEFYFAFRTNLRSEFMTSFMYISTEVRGLRVDWGGHVFTRHLPAFSLASCWWRWKTFAQTRGILKHEHKHLKSPLSRCFSETELLIDLQPTRHSAKAAKRLSV